MHVLTYRRTYFPVPVRRTGTHAQSQTEQGVEVKNLLGRQSPQARLELGAPNDRFEQEADRLANAVVSEPDSGVGSDTVAKIPTPSRIQRLHDACQRQYAEEELNSPPAVPVNLCPNSQTGVDKEQGKLQNDSAHPEIQRQVDEDEEEVIRAKYDVGQAVELTPDAASRVQTIRRGGQPLSNAERAFFEPRFARDFRQVRIHTDGEAAAVSRAMNARAFTIGKDVVFGAGQYVPGSATTQQLLAHELTHTVQQGSARELSHSEVVQRQVIDASCDVPRHNAIRTAWNRADTLCGDVLDILRNVRHAVTMPGGAVQLMPSIVDILRRTFGNDISGLEGGGFHNLNPLIDNFARIKGGFTGNHAVQCVATTDSRCGLRGAFYDSSVSDTIFLCDPTFFNNPDVDSQAELLIHEMAHSVLNATHEGLGPSDNEDIAVGMLFDCSDAAGLGLSYAVARRNAYAYQVLVACLAGSRPRPEPVVVAQSTGSESEEGAQRNELGAFGLYMPPQEGGAEIRYGRMVYGRRSGFQVFTGGSVSFLSEGNEVDLGAGVSLRYAWPHVYVGGGADVSGAIQTTVPEGEERALRLDVAPGFEVGVQLGIVRLSGGYRALIPVARTTGEFEVRHLARLGLSFAF